MWNAFANRYWPAVYLADAQGRIRYHHFGEGEYDEGEWMIQHLLREAAGEGIDNELVSVAPDGFEAQADWANLRSPETYLGYGQGLNLDSPGGVAYEEPRRALRYTEALTRAADTDRDATFRRFHDALAENFSVEEILEIVGVVVNERLDADQTCRGRDALRPGQTDISSCLDHPMSIDRTWLAGSKRCLVGEAGPRRSAPSVASGSARTVQSC